MVRQFLRKFLPQSMFDAPSRLDHDRMYMCCMFGLLVTSISMIIVGPIPNTSISNLNEFTQTTMAYAMMIGSAMCINGFLRGTRFYKPTADIRDSLMIAKWSVPAIGMSLGTYIFAIFTNYGNLLLSTLSASLGLSILIGSLWNGWDFANEADRLAEKLRRIDPDEHMD